MKRLARLIWLGLSWVILLAVVWMVLGSIAMLIARHDWFVLLLYGLSLVLFIAYGRLRLENQRLKKQIRELETGIGL